VLQGVQNILRRVVPDQPANQAVPRATTSSSAPSGATSRSRNILRYLTGIREAGERAAVIVQKCSTSARRSDSAKG
jgi:hypothetical protein